MELTMFFDTGYEDYPLNKAVLIPELVNTEKIIQLERIGLDGKVEEAVTDKGTVIKIVTESKYIDVFDDPDAIRIKEYKNSERPSEWFFCNWLCGDCDNNCGGACVYDIPLEARCQKKRVSDIYKPNEWHCDLFEPRSAGE